MEHRRKVARVRTQLVKEVSVYCKLNELSSPERAAEFARSIYYEKDGDELMCPTKECMIVCSIDAKCKPVIVEHVSVGTSHSALVDIKALYMSPILGNADGILLFHNHPSGNPMPSMEDNLMTNKIREAGKLLDIPLRDHIIVGDEGFYSYEEKRIIPWRDEYEKVG